MRKVDGWTVAMGSRTLREAHESVRRMRPAPHARPSAWHEYHQLTAQVAEVYADHHHKALYWVNYERQKLSESSRN